MNFKETTKELIRQFPCSICLVKMRCYNYDVTGSVPNNACDKFAKYMGISYYAYLRHKPIYKNLFKKNMTVKGERQFRRASMMATPLKLGELINYQNVYGISRQYEISPILTNSRHVSIISNETGRTIKLHSDILDRQLMELTNEKSD